MILSIKDFEKLVMHGAWTREPFNKGFWKIGNAEYEQEYLSIKDSVKLVMHGVWTK